jgi:hypothetical protein
VDFSRIFFGEEFDEIFAVLGRFLKGVAEKTVFFDGQFAVFLR